MLCHHLDKSDRAEGNDSDRQEVWTSANSKRLFELLLLRNLGRLGQLPSRDKQLNWEMREGAKLTLYLPVLLETTEGNIRTIWEDCKITVKRLDGKRRG